MDGDLEEAAHRGPKGQHGARFRNERGLPQAGYETAPFSSWAQVFMSNPEALAELSLGDPTLNQRRVSLPAPPQKARDPKSSRNSSTSPVEGHYLPPSYGV